MKQVFTITIALMFSLGLFAQDTLVKWTFPTDALTDTVQNGTNSLNLTRYITTEGGTSAKTMTNGVTTGDYAVTASGWDNGVDLKNWNIKFKVTGYTNIKLSSKQRSGNNPKGPKDFKAQYKISGGTWTDIPTATITLGNDWTTGVLDAVALPSDIDNSTSSIYVRWIMTSNLDLDGVDVTSAAISKIDDIIITGISTSGIEETLFAQSSVYPNPASDLVTVNSFENITNLFVYNLAGQCVYQAMPFGKSSTLSVSDLEKGIYLVKVITEESEINHKLVVE